MKTIILENKAVIENNNHPAWLYFVGVPVKNIPGSADSLVAAIDGNLNGMAHGDLVLTCQMLERGRAIWRKEAEALKATLVMLKRELDPHISDATKYELPRSAWEEVMRRHGDNPPLDNRCGA